MPCNIASSTGTMQFLPAPPVLQPVASLVLPPGTRAPQTLPDITVTADRGLWWLLPLAFFAVLLLAAGDS